MDPLKVQEILGVTESDLKPPSPVGSVSSTITTEGMNFGPVRKVAHVPHFRMNENKHMYLTLRYDVYFVNKKTD